MSTTPPPNPHDSDRDGISNADEVALGTNPYDSDSDDDGLRDGEEVTFGSNPLDADSDDDDLTDAQEFTIGTDPNDLDSDGDSVGDGVEVGAGTDPLDSESTPPPPPGEPVNEPVDGDGGLDVTVAGFPFEARDLGDDAGSSYGTGSFLPDEGLEVDLVGNYHEIDVPTPPPEAPEGFPDDPPHEVEGPGALETDPAIFQASWRVEPEEDLEADPVGLYDEIVTEDPPVEPPIGEGEDPDIEPNPAPAQADPIDLA